MHLIECTYYEPDFVFLNAYVFHLCLKTTLSDGCHSYPHLVCKEN